MPTLQLSIHDQSSQHTFESLDILQGIVRESIQKYVFAERYSLPVGVISEGTARTAAGKLGTITASSLLELLADLEQAYHYLGESLHSVQLSIKLVNSPIRSEANV